MAKVNWGLHKLSKMIPDPSSTLKFSFGWVDNLHHGVTPGWGETFIISPELGNAMWRKKLDLLPEISGTISGRHFAWSMWDGVKVD